MNEMLFTGSVTLRQSNSPFYVHVSSSVKFSGDTTGSLVPLKDERKRESVA